ncbi:MAG: hypothetical protein K2J00_07910 [Bacteroidaceae bacterium]|nr:hypothetical protein [Bacteroidaceae bacterium]
MKKYLTAILAAMLTLTSTQAGNCADDENPGGWDFELPVNIKVKRSHNTREVKFSLHSSLSFGFIGGTSQAKDVSIDMGQSYEIEWGNVIATKKRI